MSRDFRSSFWKRLSVSDSLGALVDFISPKGHWSVWRSQLRCFRAGGLRTDRRLFLFCACAALWTTLRSGSLRTTPWGRYRELNCETSLRLHHHYKIRQHVTSRKACNLYYSLNINRVTKSKRVRCTGHETYIWEVRNTYKILVSVCVVGRRRGRLEDNIVTYFSDCWRGLDW
jgi:hypothetical protein